MPRVRFVCFHLVTSLRLNSKRQSQQLQLIFCDHCVITFVKTMLKKKQDSRSNSSVFKCRAANKNTEYNHLNIHVRYDLQALCLYEEL